MKQLPTLTLTGADERTPLRELQDLAEEYYPRLEIGLLWTLTPEGRNRYPSERWLRVAVDKLGSRCAVHICGTQARHEAIRMGPSWLRFAGRVQVNGPVSGRQVELLLGNGLREVITQHNPERNPDLSGLELEGHSLLVDASGGRGFLAESWERPVTGKPVGFAGGLGPSNLLNELPLIAAVAEGRWWVDMEGRLRTPDDDWFSLDLARLTCERFKAWIDSRTDELLAAH